jgi:queuine/archaeosine tRNA-ribosyltransferase
MNETVRLIRASIEKNRFNEAKKEFFSGYFGPADGKA